MDDTPSQRQNSKIKAVPSSKAPEPAASRLRMPGAKLRRLMATFVIVAAMAGGTYWYWRNSVLYPSTDNAYVQANVVRMTQSTAEHVEGEVVRLEQSAARMIHAVSADVRQSGVLIVDADSATMRGSGILAARAGTLSVQQSGVGFVTTQDAHLEGTRAGVLVGQRVDAKNARTIVLIGRHIEGNVETLLDPRGALLLGLGFASVVGLVSILKGLLFRRLRRR
jgi:hypothetical protein